MPPLCIGNMTQSKRVPRGAPAPASDSAAIVQGLRAGDAHAFEQPEMDMAAKIDPEATAAQRRRSLDDGRLEAVAAQPIGEGRPGDARAGNQDAKVAHDVLLAARRTESPRVTPPTVAEVGHVRKTLA